MLGYLRVALALASVVSAALRDGRPNANTPPLPAVPVVDVPFEGPVTSRNGTTLPPYNTTYYFEQLIDHTNPSLGTFTQRYWFTYEFYEPGGPILLMTPGETDADGYYGYLTNGSIMGQIAQQNNGAVALIEHRFYGYSNPYPDLSVQSLRVHTIEQAINDLVYFTQNANLPMPGGNQVTPDKAPWILVGGSYSGALTSWTMVDKPGVFYAGYASSAVVEAITDYWGYFEPIRQYMPKNCSADVEAVIAYVDQVFMGGNATAIASVKANFGIPDVTHNDDAAGALRNNLWDWQSLQPDTGPGAQFFQFCDALEVKDGVSAPASGWGLEYAYAAWGAYWRNTYLELICGGDDANDCLGTYDTTQSYWTDTSINNAGRSWYWIVCNEVGFLQDGAPSNWPTLVSRLIQPVYDERQCQQMFPEAFPTYPVPNVNATNARYRGWYVQVNQLLFANGQRDPWREATVSADGLYIASTPTQPILEGDGFHCSDLLTSNAEVDSTIEYVQTQALGYMKTWLAAWKPLARRDVQSEPQAAPIRAGKPVSAWMVGSGRG
ncbi:hypothetical protein JAAARDRAFT_118335 [Jaapia argillacea MUCL 33604]|uniref:Peptidase S28 n=1 Tax=Jaapia argillacea MUCL 33604 TaxID=933084 RepID=A0A067QLU1_9AGAM|nr:hypothetical protein JAAARDRAFT_118335 [Jaapia argillacea MUCL 33604]